MSGSCLADFPVEITMDKRGDYIQAPYNTVRNDDIGMLLPTVEQGGGRGQALRKTKISRDGTFGLEYTLPPFDQNSGDTKDRIETAILSDQPIDDTIFESKFSFQIPSDSDIVRGWFLIHQWHQSSPESPPISINLAQGHRARVEILVRHGERKKGSRIVRLKRLDTSASYFDVPLDKWSDWKVYWRLSPRDPSKGLVAVFMNEQLLFSYSGVTGYSQVEDQSVTERFGIYREKDSEGTHRIYYDSLTVTAMPKDFVIPSASKLREDTSKHKQDGVAQPGSAPESKPE